MRSNWRRARRVDMECRALVINGEIANAKFALEDAQKRLIDLNALVLRVDPKPVEGAS